MARVTNVKRGAQPKPEEVQTEVKPEVEEVMVGGKKLTIITDSKGRRIGVRKLDPAGRYLLSKAIEATNMSCAMQQIMAASVVSIDDEGLPMLRNEADLLVRLNELGDEGIEAVTPLVLEMYGVANAEAVEAAKN